MRPFKLGVIFLIVFFKLKFSEAPMHIDAWVAWNIGQGQWVTHILNDYCRHFDAGGEFGSFKKIKKSLMYHCGTKTNEIALSHWDLDHFFNLPSLAKALPRVCWRYQPVFASQKAQARKILQLELPICQAGALLNYWSPPAAHTTNESSAVFSEQQALLPGDSPINQEKIWSQQLELAKIKILILGHHGSRTSSGRDLLTRLPALQFAVSSARYARYRHPHPDTLKRLREFNVPVLRTEDWGHIWFTK